MSMINLRSQSYPNEFSGYPQAQRDRTTTDPFGILSDSTDSGDDERDIISIRDDGHIGTLLDQFDDGDNTLDNDHDNDNMKHRLLHLK